MLKKKYVMPAIIASTVLATNGVLTTAAHADHHKNGGKENMAQEEKARAGKDGKGHDKYADGQSMEEYGENVQGALNDAWLDGKLETALLFNERLDSFAIDTRVKNGVVHLTGTVDSDIHRRLAEDIAQSVDGIEGVENRLKVDKKMAHGEKTAKKSDESFRDGVANATLTARIKSELLVNSDTSGLSINVDSRNESVTLSGTVNSKKEKKVAERIAREAAGERDVENDLTVERNS